MKEKLHILFHQTAVVFVLKSQSHDRYTSQIMSLAYTSDSKEIKILWSRNMGVCGGMGNNRWARRENWQESSEDRCAANGVTELNLGGDSETGNL